jgi:hypothetical protein
VIRITNKNNTMSEQMGIPKGETKKESQERYTEEQKESFYQMMSKASSASSGVKSQDIENIPIELHQYIAMRFLEEKNLWPFIRCLENFDIAVSQTAADYLIENKKPYSIERNLHKFHNLNWKTASLLMDEDKHRNHFSSGRSNSEIILRHRNVFDDIDFRVLVKKLVDVYGEDLISHENFPQLTERDFLVLGYSYHDKRRDLGSDLYGNAKELGDFDNELAQSLVRWEKSTY